MSKTSPKMGLGLLVAGLLVAPAAHSAAPLPPYGTTLSALNSGNPNGTWTLFVQDDSPLDAGIISNGWVLKLTTASPVSAASDVGVSVTASPAAASVGSNVVFVVGVTNYGPSTASNIVVTDNLPLNTTYLSNNVTQGSVVQNGSLLTWTVGTLTANSGAQLALTVRGDNVGSVANFAAASTTTPDPNPDDDVASATVIVAYLTPPQISGDFVSTNGTFQFSLTGTPGQTNVIQASTNLVDWIPIYTNVNPFLFIDPYASNYPVRFYRALGQ